MLELLHFGLNQDHGCFACGSTTGFRVFNCEPFKEQFRREQDGRGVAIVEMLFRCNLFALVGGGANPRFPPNKVMIWDDHQGRCIGELNLRSQVRAVKLRRDRIAVALEHKVLVYNFADLRLLNSIETLSNQAGLLALSAEASSTVLACPGLHQGEVRVELLEVKRTRFIKAHTNALAALALSLHGKLLATASDRGTLVRLYATADSAPLRELRRAVDPASVHCLAFSKGEAPDWLALTSDKGTVHVFDLRERGSGGSPGHGAPDFTSNGHQEQGSSGRGAAALSFARKLLAVPKLTVERSFAQLRLPEDTRSMVGFGQQPATLLVVSSDGTFCTASFDAERGGTCARTGGAKFADVAAAS